MVTHRPHQIFTGSTRKKRKRFLTKRCRFVFAPLKGSRTFDLSGTINLFLFVLFFTSVVRLKNDVRFQISNLIICFVIYEDLELRPECLSRPMDIELNI